MFIAVEHTATQLAEAFSKRAPSTTRTSLRFGFNELRAVRNRITQKFPARLSDSAISGRSDRGKHVRRDETRKGVRRPIPDTCAKRAGGGIAGNGFHSSLPSMRTQEHRDVRCQSNVTKPSKISRPPDRDAVSQRDASAGVAAQSAFGARRSR